MIPLSFEWLSRDGKLLLTARATRTFGYGFLSVILSIYLKLSGYNDLLIGLILSLTLVNSIIFTLIASFYADRLGRRKMLIVYALLMSMSGAILFVSNNYILLIIAALIGTINVTGSETGAFLSVEQAMLPQTLLIREVSMKRQNTLFATRFLLFTIWLVLLQCLQVFYFLVYLEYSNTNGLSQVQSIKPLFLLYSLLGIGIAASYFLLSEKIEIVQTNDDSLNSYERKNVAKKSLIQTLSPKLRKIVGKLSGLFAVDSFAGGFVIQSIVSLCCSQDLERIYRRYLTFFR
jgi:MFS family permease